MSDPAPWVRVYLTNPAGNGTPFDPTLYPCPECGTAKVVFVGSAGGEGYGSSLEYGCADRCSGHDIPVRTIDWVREEPDSRLTGEVSRNFYDFCVSRSGEPIIVPPPRVGDPLEGGISLRGAPP